MKQNFDDLRDFLDFLESNGNLLRIKHPLKIALEVTEVHRRLLEKGMAAAIIEQPQAADGSIYPIPMLVNLFGTVERVAWGMGKQPAELREFGRILAYLRNPTPPSGIKQAFEMLPLVKQLLAMKPKTTRSAPCQEIVLTGDQIDLYKLPIQGCWPNEPAPLITWPLVVTKGPNPKQDPVDDFNLGIYRMQVIGKDRTLMRWLKHRGGAQHHQSWKQVKRDPLPAAIVLGSDPATILAAVTPVPDNLSEYKFSSLLRGKAITLVDCKTIPIQVPANAEIILEGHVMLDEFGDEGPYGDHTGYYNSVEPFPIFKLSAITMRKNPIYLSTYTGRPPDEPAILGEALNELFIPILQQQFPEIIDFWLPPEGCSYRVAVVSINKKYAGQARRIMMGIWSFLRQFLYTKWIIVVDGDINCRDWKDVIWAVSTRVDPARDMMVIEHTPIDYLDFASPVSGLGSKVGIDATDKIDGETTREWGQKLDMDQKTKNTIDALWDELIKPV
ncbi:MAG: UbiD family decarboxylase [Alphaproteobacteria bacterium]